MVILVKDKKGIKITKAFQKILNESNRKSNKIQVDKGRKFYNKSMKSQLQKNAIEMLCIPRITKENMLLIKDLLEP